MTDEAFRKEILVALEYSYVHDSWVTPLSEALDGLAAEDALWRMGRDSRCIWEIALHVAVWNENIIERVHTRKRAHPSEGAWPALPSPADEAAWERAKKRLWGSLESVRNLIEETPVAEIQAGPYGLGDLFCRFTHNAYHIGQITKMRECMDARDKSE